MRSVHYGKIAEDFFKDLLHENGIFNNFVDTWYDFLLEGDIKVEVKSCQISVKQPRISEGRRIGRFTWTDVTHKEKQINEDIWICLIVRYNEECLLYGFLKASKLPKGNYLTIHAAARLKPFVLEEWLQSV